MFSAVAAFLRIADKYVLEFHQPALLLYGEL